MEQAIQKARALYETTPLATVEEVAEIVGLSPPLLRRIAEAQGWRKADAREPLRFDILEVHRREWEQFRELFPLEAMAADEKLARRAKLIADVLAQRQAAERLAWGVEQGTASSLVVIRADD